MKIRNEKGLFIKGHPFIKGGEKGWFKKGQVNWNKGRFKRIKLVCEYCKSNFEVHYCRRYKAKYCSRECWKKGHNSWSKGLTKETDKRIKNRSGERSYQWKGGISTTSEYGVMLIQKRRALKRGNGGSFTTTEWETLKKKYNYMCLCCKQQEPFIKLSVDHIIPLSKGGLNDIKNIQPLCKSCNSKKFIKTTNFIKLWQNNI